MATSGIFCNVISNVLHIILLYPVELVLVVRKGLYFPCANVSFQDIEMSLSEAGYHVQRLPRLSTVMLLECEFFS